MSKSKEKSSTAPTSIWPTYGSNFAKLQNQSQGALGQAAAAARPLFNTAMGGAMGVMNNPTGQIAGNQALSGIANASQVGANDPALQAYSRQVGQNFNENILPTISQGAFQSSSLGGSRGQVGAAQAAAKAQQNIQDFAGQQYNNQMNRQLQAANIGAGMFNQGQQNQLAAALGMPGFLNIYQQPYMNQREILGSPITIGGGGSSKGKSFGL